MKFEILSSTKTLFNIKSSYNVPVRNCQNITIPTIANLSFFVPRIMTWALYLLKLPVLQNDWLAEYPWGIP